MKHLHYWLILILVTVLFFGGGPRFASLQILEHPEVAGLSLAKLTNESAGIIWVDGYFPWRPVLGYQRKIGNTWESQFGKGCGNDWRGRQPLLPGQSISYEVGLSGEWTRVAARVSPTIGGFRIVASSDSSTGR
jgi:hypothetical protein